MDLYSRLEQINKAISAIESGAQEYQIGSRKVRKADLKTLYSERDRVERQIADSENSGNVYVAMFDRR